MTYDLFKGTKILSDFIWSMGFNTHFFCKLAWGMKKVNLNIYIWVVCTKSPYKETLIQPLFTPKLHAQKNDWVVLISVSQKHSQPDLVKYQRKRWIYTKQDLSLECSAWCDLRGVEVDNCHQEKWCQDNYPNPTLSESNP